MAPKSHKGLATLAVIAVLLAGLLAGTVCSPADASGASALELSADDKQRVKVLTKNKRVSTSKVRFWKDQDRGRWALHLRYGKCWQVKGKQRRKLCTKARRSLTVHTARIKLVQQKLQALQGELGNIRDWLCIHNGEGDWEDGGDTYWGGMQMDLDFMEAHGRDMLAKYGKPRGVTGPNGWENPWTPREQVIVAQRAKQGIRTSLDDGRIVFWQDRPRGYNPWPNTARDCGLL